MLYPNFNRFAVYFAEFGLIEFKNSPEYLEMIATDEYVVSVKFDRDVFFRNRHEDDLHDRLLVLYNLLCCAHPTYEDYLEELVENDSEGLRGHYNLATDARQLFVGVFGQCKRSPYRVACTEFMIDISCFFECYVDCDFMRHNRVYHNDFATLLFCNPKAHYSTDLSFEYKLPPIAYSIPLEVQELLLTGGKDDWIHAYRATR